MSPRPFLIGLTGGIGAGKSTVAARFEGLGIPVADTDAIAHALTVANGTAMPAIRAEFGTQFVTTDGALDRIAMRKLVFGDAHARRRLESILHPLIREEAMRQLEVLAWPVSGALPAPYLMLAVPLLFEGMGFRAEISRSLLVDVPVDLQVERVVRRSRMSEQEATRIVNSQIARSLRLQLADDVLGNTLAPDALDAPIAALHAKYIGLASRENGQA